MMTTVKAATKMMTDPEVKTMVKRVEMTHKTTGTTSSWPGKEDVEESGEDLTDREREISAEDREEQIGDRTQLRSPVPSAHEHYDDLVR